MLGDLIKKIILLGTEFLKGSINGDDFKWAYNDIYYYKIKKYKFLTAQEQILFYELENFKEAISYYCSIPELRTQTNLAIDERKLAEITKKFIKKLNEYTKKYGIKKISSEPEDLSNKTVMHLKNIIFTINKFLSLRIEEDDLIKNISEILMKFEPKSATEHKIQKITANALNKLKYSHQPKIDELSTQNEDPFKKRYPFIENVNELKENLYLYLNPERESK